MTSSWSRIVHSAVTILAVVASVWLVASPASATWGASGVGTVAGAAATVNAGNEPSGSASGSAVTIGWAPSTLSDGAAVSGYVISRYAVSNGSPATVNPGCSGVISTTTCTELSVPAGSWEYTVTPVLANWRGSASSYSSPIVASS